MPVNTVRVASGKLTIGAIEDMRNLTAQVTSCVLTPSVDTGDPVMNLAGEQVAGDTTRTWTLDATIFQDFGAVDSVVEFCFENAGSEMPFSYTPNSSTGKTIDGTLVVEAVAIGGEAGTKATSEFSFQVLGTPTINPITTT